MNPPAQLPLDFDHRPALTGEDFLVTPCNADAVAWLDQWRDWAAPMAVLCGAPGCGKSHLAQVFMAATGARAIQPEELTSVEPPELIEGVDACVIEDADQLLSRELETPLFHLYNTARDGGVKILLTARVQPSRWDIELADLRSRLTAAPSAEIGTPDDGLMGALLVKQFADRQLKVDADVVGFLLPRMERSFDAIRRLVVAVDDHALASRRNITIPLVRQVLDAMNGS